MMFSPYPGSHIGMMHDCPMGWGCQNSTRALPASEAVGPKLLEAWELKLPVPTHFMPGSGFIKKPPGPGDTG